MAKDLGLEQRRTLFAQSFLTDDELQNYPSYGWPLKCPAPRGGFNTLRVPECDGVRGACQLCGAQMEIRRYKNIISISARAVVPQLHIQMYNDGVRKGRDGDFESALELFDRALSFRYDRPSIECRALARDAMSGRLSREAAAEFFSAVDHYDEGNAEESLEELLTVAAKSPRYARALSDIGQRYIATGQTEKAMPMFKYAVECDPQYATGQFNLALACSQQGMEAEAIEHYRAAIEIDDGFAEAHNNLAFIYASRGDFVSADQKWFKAVKLGYTVDIDGIQRITGSRKARSGCLPMLIIFTAGGLGARFFEHLKGL